VTVLDLLLIAGAISFALSGYRQGFIIGLLSFAGFLGGGVLGMLVVPQFLAQLEPSLFSSSIAIGVVLATASFGMTVTSVLGSKMRQRLTWQPAQLADSAGGAAVGAASLLMVAWFLGAAIAGASIPVLSDASRESRIFRAMDQAVPPGVTQRFSAFANSLDANGFPTVFAPFATDEETIREVAPPDPRLPASAVARQAQDSIVKVLGTARSCSREVEGTGFVYANQRVMTNAHVVAGVRSPVVLVGGRLPALPARVVYFDPATDVAVLYVPDLDAPPLQFSNRGRPNGDAIVAGFPNNGRFTVSSARIRSRLNAVGMDIYQASTVTREVFSLYANVQPGNSGGPLLDTQGDVVGVIFAKSLDSDQTGYALTTGEVASSARAGVASTLPVSTQGCA